MDKTANDFISIFVVILSTTFRAGMISAYHIAGGMSSDVQPMVVKCGITADLSLALVVLLKLQKALA